jgi:hypothetical protein
MTTTIIVLSVICAALALLSLYLILYVYLTNKMLESKDLIIMELQRRDSLKSELTLGTIIYEVTKRLKEAQSVILEKDKRPGK